MILESENVETYFRLTTNEYIKYQALLLINSSLSYIGKIISEDKEKYYSKDENAQTNLYKSQLE